MVNTEGLRQNWQIFLLFPFSPHSFQFSTIQCKLIHFSEEARPVDPAVMAYFFSTVCCHTLLLKKGTPISFWVFSFIIWYTSQTLTQQPILHTINQSLQTWKILSFLDTKSTYPLHVSLAYAVYDKPPRYCTNSVVKREIKWFWCWHSTNASLPWERHLSFLGYTTLCILTWWSSKTRAIEEAETAASHTTIVYTIVSTIINIYTIVNIAYKRLNTSTL